MGEGKFDRGKECDYGGKRYYDNNFVWIYVKANGEERNEHVVDLGVLASSESMGPVLES